MVKEKAGIYKITNFKNGKVYIGSSLNVDVRKEAHIHCLRTGKGSPILQQDFIDYGSDVFTFEILEYCSPDELREKENYYIIFYESTNKSKGYNIQRTSHRVFLNIDKANKRQFRKMIDLSPEAFEIYKSWGSHEKSQMISKLITDYADYKQGKLFTPEQETRIREIVLEMKDKIHEL